MDISMPVMDGYEATMKIREFEEKNLLQLEQRAMIVGLSGHSTDAYKTKGLSSGMDDFSKNYYQLISFSD